MNYFLVKGDSEIHIGKSEEGRQFMFDISGKGMGLQPDQMTVLNIWNYLTRKVGECYRIINEYGSEFSRYEFFQKIGGEFMPSPLHINDYAPMWKGIELNGEYLSADGIYFTNDIENKRRV